MSGIIWDMHNLVVFIVKEVESQSSEYKTYESFQVEYNATMSALRAQV